MGIDPGFHVTGYAVLKYDEYGKSYLLDYGYLQMSPKKKLPEIARFEDVANMD